MLCTFLGPWPEREQGYEKKLEKKELRKRTPQEPQERAMMKTKREKEKEETPICQCQVRKGAN